MKEVDDDEYEATYEYPWKPNTLVSAEWFFGPGLTAAGMRYIRKMWIAETNRWPHRRENPFICTEAPEAFFLVFPMWWLRKIFNIVKHERKWLRKESEIDREEENIYQWKTGYIWKDEELACASYDLDFYN